MPPLPNPADHPAAEVLIYDGHCQFCTKQVRRICGWDGKNRIAFLSLHDPVVAQLYPDLSHDEMMKAMVIVDHTGKYHRGAAAIRRLTIRLPRLWLLAPFLHIPFSLPIWSIGYRWIARRRYQLNCEDESCSIHFRK